MKNYTNIKYNSGVIILKNTPVCDRKPGARYTVRRTYRFPVYYSAFLLQEPQRCLGGGISVNMFTVVRTVYTKFNKCVSEGGATELSLPPKHVQTNLFLKCSAQIHFCNYYCYFVQSKKLFLRTDKCHCKLEYNVTSLQIVLNLHDFLFCLFVLFLNQSIVVQIMKTITH